MSEDLEFFSTDFNNWNYNEFINKSGVDPYNKKKLDPFGCNLLKYNCVIMLKEILKHTKQYLKAQPLWHDIDLAKALGIGLVIGFIIGVIL